MRHQRNDARVAMPLNVEADHVPAFGEKALGPTTQAAEQINAERPHKFPLCFPSSDSNAANRYAAGFISPPLRTLDRFCNPKNTAANAFPACSAGQDTPRERSMAWLRRSSGSAVRPPSSQPARNPRL